MILNVISMVITKKIAIEYTQKEIKMEFKHFTTKNQLKTKEDSIVGNDRQNAVRRTENIEQNDRSKCILIRNYFNVNGLNSQIKR